MKGYAQHPFTGPLNNFHFSYATERSYFDVSFYMQQWTKSCVFIEQWKGEEITIVSLLSASSGEAGNSYDHSEMSVTALWFQWLSFIHLDAEQYILQQKNLIISQNNGC